MNFLVVVFFVFIIISFVACIGCAFCCCIRIPVKSGEIIQQPNSSAGEFEMSI